MVKRIKRLKDTKSQKDRKKKLRHYGGKAQPMDFHHHSITENWDRQKTLKQNYHSLGLCTDPNKALPIQVNGEHGDEKESVDNVKKHAVIKELDKIQQMGPVPSYEVRSMNIKEQARLHALINKYGDDIVAMSKDHKLNIMQETQAQLKKRIAIYNRLKAL